MLSAYPAQPNNHHLPVDSQAIQSQQESSLGTSKQQQVKKPKVTWAKLLAGLALLLVLGLVTYKLITLAFPQKAQSKYMANQSKFIQYADSSKDTNSNSGSQTSTTSKDSNKPVPAAKTISKEVFGPSGGRQGGSGGEDPNDDENNGEEREKQKRKNTRDGSSTEDDSESIDQDDSQSTKSGNAPWPVNPANSHTPLVGNIRGRF